jgi:adenylosuccinate synthase
MHKITMVIDLQYGSTGKGLLVGYLAETTCPDTIVTAWAPNAGHTYIDRAGRKFIHTHLANGIVSPFCKRVFLGPGSLIDPMQLLDEIAQCEDIIDARGIRIMIHPHAAIVTQRHRDLEAGPMTKIGSTKKGVGAAMIQRIERNPDDMNIASREPLLNKYVVSQSEYQDMLGSANHILVEGAQGFGLSMYHGFYPYTTSRDVTVWQILADCGIPRAMAKDLEVFGTCRTYPIRVANRYDADGKQVGYSGPVYDDQSEVTFESIGQEQELTTVTKLPRRIFTFSLKQIAEAIEFNGVDRVFLNFANYVNSENELIRIIDAIECAGSRVCYLGLGPRFRDVIETDFWASGLRRSKLLTAWRAQNATS